MDPSGRAMTRSREARTDVAIRSRAEAIQYRTRALGRGKPGDGGTS
ncbi:MAG: hypothetical protein QOE01_825 [Actinomycetota bacterium]|jgi:hypothetical protein|nr:hypothetical protein [Actinomycetota bacterium]